MTENYWIYLLVMVGTTYIIRTVPFALFTKKITNRFVKSVLEYVPYAVLASMTIPAILYCTNSIYSGIAGLVVAVGLALMEKSLIIVALGSSVAVYLVELLIK